MNRTEPFAWFHVDLKRAKDYSLDAIAKRVIAGGAILLVLAGSLPIVTTVHGQLKSPLDYEVQDLRERVSKVESLPTDVALIIAHQKLEDERYKDQQDLEGKLLEGFLALTGGIFTAILGWALHQFGVNLGGRKRSEG